MMRPQQVRAARALLGWSRGRLAKEAGVGASTIKAFENEATDTRLSIARKIEETITKAGIEFINPSRSGGAGVRLKK